MRRFNRFYTARIGVLQYLGGDFSLGEVRILYELAHRADPPTAAELGRELRVDAGYLSRLLRGFERRRPITRTRSDVDGRRSHLALTAAGRAAFAPLGARSRDASAAGSPRRTVRASDPCSSCGIPRRSRSCACCSSSPRRAASVWARDSSRSASASRARPAIARSCSGRTACWWPRAASTKRT